MRTLDEVKSAAIRDMQTGSLELGEKVMTNKVSSYTDQTLFERERSQVVFQRPIPVGPSAKVKDPGDFFAVDVWEVPVVVVRTESGQVKVYLNVCRHRGAKLTSEKSGRSCKNLVCPFHGWTYSLNGEVTEIPNDSQGFVSAPKSGFQLKELTSYEYLGMIWVILDNQENGLDIVDQFKQVKGDLDVLGFVPTFPVQEKSIVANFNWKIGVEAFLEVYHFAHAHAPYLSQLQFPNLSLADANQENCRIVVPLKNPIGDEPILKWAQVMYFIFPSSFLLFYEDHVALISLVPVAVDKTQFQYIPLVPDENMPDLPKIKQKIEFLETIIGQDIAILEGIQCGLRSKANVHFTFTRLEYLLGKFHGDLGRSLES